jgi:prolipoprotein diacylglyceryltransferase
MSEPSVEKVSTNALYALVVFAGVFVAALAAFTSIILTQGFASIPGEVIAFFSGGIGVLGTILGTLINALWGE